MAFKKKYFKKNESEKKTAYDLVAENIMLSISNGETLLPTRDRKQGSIFKGGSVRLKPYSGINAIRTEMVSEEKGYLDAGKEKYGDDLGNIIGSKYATYNFIKDNVEIFGEYAIKGKKADLAISSPGELYWYYFNEEGKRKKHYPEKDEQGKDIPPSRSEIEQKKLHSGSSSKLIPVFNLMQFELDEKYIEKIQKKLDQVIENPIQHMENKEIIKDVSEAMEITVKETMNIDENIGGYYLPSKNSIALRPSAIYPDESHLMRIFFHEISHSTGSEDRLDRSTLRNYSEDIKERAKEELTAELGAAFLCQHFGIGTNSLGHDGYISGWMEVLKEDSSLVTLSINEARKASDFVINKYESHYENKYGINLKEQLDSSILNIESVENKIEQNKPKKVERKVGMAI